ncbi:hypothetical protein [Alicyclobacillus sendaiensis]|uniref:hypothetical protein n=1 Tax=Alicyclobacillus sendaiensis TaxID=192387 RepID=UPI0026F4417C|nr:hypothetical protein [Alicyclobacillus sendaiensis]
MFADAILASHGKQSPATVGWDVAALVPDIGVVKEGKEILSGLKDISHAVQHSAEYFSKEEYQWKTVSKIYGDLGGAIISAANTLSSSQERKDSVVVKKAAEQLDIMYKTGIAMIVIGLLFWILDSFPWIYQHARWCILGFTCASLAVCIVIVCVAGVRFVVFCIKRM